MAQMSLRGFFREVFSPQKSDMETVGDTISAGLQVIKEKQEAALYELQEALIARCQKKGNRLCQKCRHFHRRCSGRPKQLAE